MAKAQNPRMPKVCRFPHPSFKKTKNLIMLKTNYLCMQINFSLPVGLSAGLISNTCFVWGLDALSSADEGGLFILVENTWTISIDNYFAFTNLFL